MQFKKWFYLREDSDRTMAKSGLYPLSYGAGQYPPIYFIPSAADAIYYLTADDRLFKDHEPAPFDITHIPATKNVIPPKFNGPGGKVIKPNLNDPIEKPNYKIPPGKVVKPTKWVKLVTNPKLLDPKDH